MISMPSLTDLCLSIALEAHRGQVDKAGEPYIWHPIRVAQACDSEETRCAALLHDVIEDSHFTAEDLLALGVPASVVDAVKVLTRHEGTPYFVYIASIKGNDLSRMVKLADLKDNMDMSRLRQVTDDDLARLKKYQSAFSILTS